MKQMSPVVRTITKFAFAPIFLFGTYIILHGHLTPGGGFQGGAIIATLFALYFVAFAANKWKKSLLSTIESSGLLIFIGTGLMGLISGFFFFNFLGGKGHLFFGQEVEWSNWTYEGISITAWPANSQPLLSSGTVAVMNMAVGLEVIAALTLIVITIGMFASTNREGGE
ncbi:MAG: MnhB domain-containing protein [Candidatus Thermoplasmatota archaeon]|nr:MnhB domain-containing protein [Candidatus Thermoplasmatota archaeon]